MSDKPDDEAIVLPNDTYEDTVLDLHVISLLLNYERGATEPRFRHAKLREVATTSDFQTIRVLAPDWAEATAPRTGLVFDKTRPKSKVEEDEPDLPSNILPQPVPQRLKGLSSKQLETYYWQARNHDGCFRTVTLFQHFIDLFPQHIRIRVRSIERDKPRVYTTLALERLIIEFDLIEQSSLTLAAVFPENMTYISGADPTIIHAVLGFASPGGEIDTILDLASLQFGDVGRGFKGRGLFVLEPVAQYLSRLDKFSKRNTFRQAKLSQRINDAPDSEWLRKVAKRVKDRWDNRTNEPWCGHCGAPPRGQELKRCTKCKKAYYCDADHQLAAWPFHKHFCESVDALDNRTKRKTDAEQKT